VARVNPTEFAILGLLAKEPRSGYDIKKEVEELWTMVSPPSQPWGSGVEEQRTCSDGPAAPRLPCAETPQLINTSIKSVESIGHPYPFQSTCHSQAPSESHVRRAGHRNSQ
jgi:hypothetical protein